MAGIGFHLRALSEKHTLSSTFMVWGHAALASSGPWLITILALGGVITLGHAYLPLSLLSEFKMLIVYNFALSLILTSPVVMVITRLLADALYNEDMTPVPGLLFSGMLMILGSQLPICVLFYALFTTIDLLTLILTCMCFLFISFLWLTGVFVSALRRYYIISFAYILGMAVALGSIPLLYPYGIKGLMIGFTCGVGLTVSLLLARILAEFHTPLIWPAQLLTLLKRYGLLAASGLVYALGIWIDKFVMWTAPEAESLGNGLISYPNYDSAMFIAYLTIVPAMAFFLVYTETTFHEHYEHYFRGLQKKIPFRQIEKYQDKMRSVIFSSASMLILMQGIIALLTIALAPQLLHWVNGHYLQLGMFRSGVLGAWFHVLFLFITILLSYFDARKQVFWLQMLFLCSNGLLTWWSLSMGYNWYGYGYFLACVISFLAGAAVLLKWLGMLHYHAFITTNQSVQR